jgi:AcrR family transcriptional regulator
MSDRGRAAFIEAACEILAVNGADALTVTALCEQMHVTKGSFYYHFADMTEFVVGFVEAFELDFLNRIAAARAESDPVLRTLILNAYAFEMSHPLYAAVRAWGNSNSVVRAALARGSRVGEQLLREIFDELVGDAHRAEVLAHMATSLIIGIQQRAVPLDASQCAEIYLEFARANLGLDAEVVRTSAGPRLTACRRDAPTYPTTG